jgi:flagellar hook-associated protein 1
MSGIPAFSGLQSSLRALLAQQAAIDTTGHNIANANTVGYTRQTVQLAATQSLTLDSAAKQNGSGAQLGQGVDVQSYQRVRDLFGDLQYRAASTTYGQQDQATSVLGNIEDVVGEPSTTGISSLFDKFYSSWNALAQNPTSNAAKNAVAGAGANLASSINQLQANLATVQTNAAQQLTALTGTNGPVQTAAQQIAALNTQIVMAQGAGQQPNDLLDKRDQLLDSLSQYAQVSSTPQTDGSIQVSLDGQQVVDGSTFTWPTTYTATNGQLGALSQLSSGTGTIAGYMGDLDGVASQLASTVNAINPGFFSGTTAATLQVSAAVKASPSTAIVPGSGGDDSTYAQQIAALSGSATDAADSFATLVSKIGADSANAQRSRTNAQSLQAAASDRRQSIEGVSMDEEMTNLVRFQRGYQAASRAFTTMDDMLDQLINRTGKVGM